VGEGIGDLCFYYCYCYCCGGSWTSGLISLGGDELKNSYLKRKFSLRYLDSTLTRHIGLIVRRLCCCRYTIRGRPLRYLFTCNYYVIARYYYEV